MSVIRIDLFVMHPWLALVPGVAFAGLALRSRRATAWLAAAAWLVYAAYEGAMAARLFPCGDCNIRVDLLLAYPVLLIVSVAAIVTALLRPRARAAGA